VFPLLPSSPTTLFSTKSGWEHRTLTPALLAAWANFLIHWPKYLISTNYV
jgi:hypothetical protein